MKVTVIKRNPKGQETWRYRGEVIERGENYLILEAFFDRDDLAFHGMQLCRGDRFVETYYTDRWYNIFEIHDRDDDKLKGWYCNVATPAIIEGDSVSYRDLALDLLVFPDGRQIVLDEDEFAALSLSPKMRAQAQTALRNLQAIFDAGAPSDDAPAKFD